MARIGGMSCLTCTQRLHGNGTYNYMYRSYTQVVAMETLSYHGGIHSYTVRKLHSRLVYST